MSVTSAHGTAHSDTPAIQSATIETRDWLIAAAAAIVALIALYAVFMDNGSLISATGDYLHEFAHDGRHLFGAPCH
ncbi:CbtB domain-containing protein [Streptomyces aureoverticillatus]|uniref:CbtB domain-containing protein n=1 Tax=Streptomyces aureoverticillatus TaxID=66871 RepID=UPI0013DA1CF4|nr:CbtB-domain containing protein [Streptomyces aureoverticillatus]QIB45612.1 CbtB-domain containing protein [Streptomyces aureoverticillatus]